MRSRTSRSGLLSALAVLGLALHPGRAISQISLSTAVDLSLKNSPKIKAAQADVAHAKAVLSESRDAFIPAISAVGGVGKATGAPLSPPVVFSIAAQSLVFSMSQPDYIRAARAGVVSAQLALEAARGDVAEDTVNTYVTLDNALQRRAVQRDAITLAGYLVTITQERYDAGVDPHIELTKAKRTEAQIRLQLLLIDDEIGTQAEHLARSAGLPATGLETVHSSVPAFHPPAPDAGERTQTNAVQGTSAAFAAARAKEYTAHGDKRYLLRPRVAFSANYSRISTAFNTYTQYYPSFGAAGNSFNSLNLGVEFTLPILDMVHRARAEQAAADAAHSLYDAQSQQNQFIESRSKLRRTARELAAQQEIAALDRDLAQDQLDAVLIRLQAAAGAAPGEQLTPKDAENARLDERRRTLDMLNTQLQLEQTEIMLLRQEGTLTGFLASSLPGAAPSTTGAAPSTTGAAPSPTGAASSTTVPVPTTPTPAASLPPTVGVEPGAAPTPGTGQGTAPGSAPGSAPGTVPATVPTVGTTPSSLPSAPVSAPAPTPSPAPPTTVPKP